MEDAGLRRHRDADPDASRRPEGARDFLVPVAPAARPVLRAAAVAADLQAAAHDRRASSRYYQIATLLPRRGSPRRPPFRSSRQLDVELAFPDREECLRVSMERIVQRSGARRSGVELETAVPAADLATRRCARYGSDKPDLRFGLELAGRDRADARLGVRRLRTGAERALPASCRRSSRARELDGARGVREGVGRERASPTSSSTRRARCARRSRSSSPRSELDGVPRPSPATTVLFGADEPGEVARVLGALRLHLGRELGLIDETPCRVPLGDRLPAVRVGRGRASAGRPSTTRSRGRPTATSDLLETDPGARAQRRRTTSSATATSSAAARSGSTSRRSRQRVFDLLGITPEEPREKFGFLLDALAMGAPPHGGFAMGIDRCRRPAGGRAEHPRAIAFPKNQATGSTR